MAAKTAYIGLGSNLGDRKANIDGALKMLADAEQITFVRVSDIVETAPLGQSNQPDYLNAIAELRTELNPEDLFKKLQDIETLLGRVRQGKWSPRTIDLDLLLFGNDVVNDPDLIVPHPQMHLRSFVLKGLRQLDGDLIHPVMKESVDELAGRLNGLDFTLNSELPQLVSIAGNIGVGKTTLAGKLAKRFGCKVLLEPYDTNPFLPEVYAGKKELALDSQLYFLTSRVEQLGPGVLAEGQIYISDYVFDKELVYARRLLDEQQFALYEDIYRPLAAKVSAPVLVIYMCDSPQDCLDRIHSRNRPYEQQIRLQFLETLSSDYERLFGGWKACPVIRVPKAEDVDVEHLTDQIKCYTSGHFIVASGARQSKM
ncbi:MAG: 2-amino-4-hydroxy-6-hydroxymethyldihydropteridine diphosphokinase [Planctomycetes bacterium B3_Pla]|nr:MAG: 2-amino-4-hydroxy-6-hydroxymethyldihydropteridine diphosphokinase [Planctomycetes bacterium B3_Pla]